MDTFIASPERKCSHCETGYIYQATQLEVFCLTCGNQLSSDPDLVHTYQGHGWDEWIVKIKKNNPVQPPKQHTTWTPEYSFPNPDPKEKGMTKLEIREYRAVKLGQLLKTYPNITQTEVILVTGWVRPSLKIYAEMIGHTFKSRQGKKPTNEETRQRFYTVSQRLYDDPDISSRELSRQEGIPRKVVQEIARQIGHTFKHWRNKESKRTSEDEVTFYADEI